MKPYALILTGVLLFNSCVTTKIFDYQSLQGASIKSAIYQLGMPDDEQDMNEFIVYTWYGTQIPKDIFRSGDFRTYYECEIEILVEYEQIIKVETRGNINKCPGRYN